MNAPSAYTYSKIVGSVIFPQAHNISYSERTVGNKAKYKQIFGMKQPQETRVNFLLRGNILYINHLYQVQNNNRLTTKYDMTSI